MLRPSSRKVFASVVLAVCTIVPAAAVAAPLAGAGSAFSHNKTRSVHVTLQNKTATPMNLLLNDKPFTIAANGSYKLEAEVGATVYDAESKVVKLTVSKELDGTTCSFR